MAVACRVLILNLEIQIIKKDRFLGSYFKRVLRENKSWEINLGVDPLEEWCVETKAMARENELHEVRCCSDVEIAEWREKQWMWHMGAVRAY